MRTPVRALLVALVFATPAFAQPKKWSAGPLAEPRQRLLKGNYEEARAAFEEVAKKDEKLRPACAIGISQTYRQVGEVEKALAVLTDAQKATPEHPDLLAARADLLYEMGRWDEASGAADSAVSKYENNVLARWTKARVLRDKGQVDEADKAFRWIVRHYTARSNADNDITDPDELLIVAYAGAENARWHNLSRQFSFILNEVVADALKADPDLWPAEHLAGSMLLEKYNRPDAVDAFDKALKINPKAADALAGKGLAALQKFDLKDAEGYADRALKVNPRHAGALRVKADVYLVASDWTTAEKLLDQARATNPRHPATLGRQATCYLLQRRAADFDRVVKEAESFDAKPGAFYHELAECLEERKRYTQAEHYYKKAADLRPMLSAPRAGLGMLYLRLGREQEGRDILTKAFDADPFNVRVANSLKVMRHLDKYATLTTPHYELRYDPEKDKLLAEFLAEYLEEVHADLRQQFNYEPPGKILIEVFNSHDMFSGRTIGLPDLHTIGACTGKVVAMASPAAKGVSKPFNWGRVIRHELTHIFNLAQTDFMCPHWLTEGLAVRNEQMARPPMWTTVLRDKLAADELFTLDTVMLGFVRPKGPDEWTLAYCQSQLYVDYLTKTHGEATVGKLLDAFRQGMDTTAALKAACNVEKESFEKGYRAYVEEVVKPYRSQTKKEEEKPMTFAELEAAHKKDPDDPDLSARLADQLMRRNKASEARKLIEAALAKKPGHPLASIAKSRLIARSGDDDAARAALEEAQKTHPDDPRLLMALSRAHLDAKDYPAAAKVLEHGRNVCPLDGDWLEQLARLYKMTEETDKLLGVLQELVAHDPDELDGRVRLARVSLEAGKPADAERFAKDALRIDVHNEDARKALIESLKGQNKTTEVEKLLKRFGTP
ncbi:MAG TPA: tetratricopeptide repeat protein [Fimbriiglobus sp.]|nr:tetratricopeptide repeat protein [Fimbriiglobus sp.]